MSIYSRMEFFYLLHTSAVEILGGEHFCMVDGNCAFDTGSLVWYFRWGALWCVGGKVPTGNIGYPCGPIAAELSYHVMTDTD